MKCPQKSHLWFELTLICVFISFPYTNARCQGIENMTVSIYPEGVIRVLYGQPLEIFCTTEESIFTSNDIEFMNIGKTIPSETVNNTTIRLFIEKPEKQVTTYYCQNKKTKKICTSRVLVDSTPMPVTDFSCISKNLDILNCSWTSRDQFSFTKYDLTFSVDGKSVDATPAIKSQKTRYCVWNTYTQPRYRQTKSKYYFHLQSCNTFGCNNQSFTVDHFSIVKPDAPANLKVLKNYSDGIYLQWSIPNNMIDLLTCGVDHRIEYQIAKIDSTSYFRSVDASSLPPKNTTYRFLLSDLPYAHMKYEIRIYIKSKEAVKEEFWSEFTYIMAYTSSDKPRRPPDTAVGAFDQSLFESDRMIYIYWRQLEEYEESSTNFTYEVAVHYNKNDSKILTPDKKKSLSFVVLEKAPLEAMDVYIWSKNDDGSSLNSNYLHIPPKENTERLKVHAFTTLSYENGTYKLSWIGINQIDNYTLFWCEHKSSKVCEGKMSFTLLNSDKTMYFIELPNDVKYQFAISANNGTDTSGMVWASCDISKDAIPMYGFPVKMNHDTPGTTFVTLKWEMTCTLQEGIITGYHLSYCPALDTTHACAETKTQIDIPDPKRMQINITNLRPHTTYQFHLALNTIYGLKIVENAVSIIRTTNGSN